ncbi:alginate lyase family protein [Pedobacter sp. Leaf250]|uniref:alginate lyase family protein n=1 Tax=Pedobacter sp. Leaf250 TaxID=2876559 RepID=UPI0011F437AE|nr:alginate lyase family protein [Pedobacter sp. Leaf250]RZJ89455.1 MAG: hypothetical protein EOO20_10925 [Chryseobacterium sp.]
MNPNFTYAQYITGLNDGRGIGIIETRGLIDIPEALALLQESKFMVPQTINVVKLWFGAYLKWLLNSPNGKGEKLEKNNHGTNYDLQVIDFAQFLGDEILAKKTIDEITLPRLEIQFDEEGRQPLETARTNSWDYVNMNLDGWLKLARLSENVDVDLWNKKNAKGSGIEAAVKWLLPYVKKQQKWPYQ